MLRRRDELIGALSRAATTGRLDGALAPYLHPHVLVIDELGYLSHAADAANVLYRVVNERYLAHRPLLLTTNKPLAALGEVLHDGDLAEAILDRLRARLPQLRGYSALGELMWWLGIDGFIPLEISGTRKGGAAMLFPTRGAHAAMALVPWERGPQAFFQVGAITLDSTGRNRRHVVMHTFLIDVNRRTGEYVGAEWPVILHWSADRIIASRDSPHPELVIFSK